MVPKHLVSYGSSAVTQGLEQVTLINSRSNLWVSISWEDKECILRHVVENKRYRINHLIGRCVCVSVCENVACSVESLGAFSKNRQVLYKCVY